MDDTSQFDDNELTEDLTEEDLKILQAFDAKEGWHTAPPPAEDETTSRRSNERVPEPDQEYIADEDMLLLFLDEADEDIKRLQQGQQQLEKEEQQHTLQPARFTPLQRNSHKLRGTAGAIGCTTLSTAAGYIETIAEQVRQGFITPKVGLTAITPAIFALIFILDHLSEYKAEPTDTTFLSELEITFQELGINLDYFPTESLRPITIPKQAQSSLRLDEEQEQQEFTLSTQLLRESNPATTFIRVDAQRLTSLVQHTEHLTVYNSAITEAQKQVDQALQELQVSQGRLKQYESMLSLLPNDKQPSPQIAEATGSSSLITRILHEASLDTTRIRRKKTPLPPSSMNAALPMWDELDMEKYTERDLLIRSLREAIADITISTTHVQTAYTRLHTLQQEYTNRLAIIRNDTLLLRLTPLKTLIPHLERAIATNTLPQGQNIHLEVVGDTIEIDRDILETLAGPLSQMLATCIDDLSFVQQDPQSAETPPTSSPQIWLHASSIGHDVTLEIGFSMTIQGGAIANIRNTIQDLNGTISSQRNNKGGISFVLHIPRSQGSLQGFLVRIGQQYLLAPISQIHRVDDMTNTRLDMTYHLEDLLGFTKDEPETRSAKTGLLPQLQPVLLLQRETSRKTIGIIVDEVIGEIELVVKPLLPFLQRPGILGSAVDGKGRILLVLDMYGLVRHYAYRDLQQENAEKNPVPSTPHRRQATILVADDSVFLRQSVLQTLHHEKYHVIEAKDGLEALEQLLDHTPDVFLLDIEMPNLNGYDVLSIMQLYPEFSHIKIIMLTSRSSEKHIQRARDLGAHAYLTKPVPQETLLGTVQRMLAQQEVKKTPETDPPE